MRHILEGRIFGAIALALAAAALYLAMLWLAPDGVCTHDTGIVVSLFAPGARC